MPSSARSVRSPSNERVGAARRWRSVGPVTMRRSGRSRCDRPTTRHPRRDARPSSPATTRSASSATGRFRTPGAAGSRPRRCARDRGGARDAGSGPPIRGAAVGRARRRDRQPRLDRVAEAPRRSPPPAHPGPAGSPGCPAHPRRVRSQSRERVSSSAATSSAETPPEPLTPGCSAAGHRRPRGSLARHGPTVGDRVAPAAARRPT